MNIGGDRPSKIFFDQSSYVVLHDLDFTTKLYLTLIERMSHTEPGILMQLEWGLICQGFFLPLRPSNFCVESFLAMGLSDFELEI